MRFGLAVLSLVITVTTAGADVLRRDRTSDAAAPTAPTAGGAIVVRDDARREVQAWLLPAETQAARIAPAAARGGRLIVRNRSRVSADVYLARPADAPAWEFVETVPHGFKLIVRDLIRRTDYVIAAEVSDLYDGFFDWGPRQFRMRKRFRYTLLP